MKTRYRAWLDGQALEDVADTILIKDIRESAPEMRERTMARAGGGLRMTLSEREKLTVTICAEVHEEEPEKRQEVIDRLAAWAQGRSLTASTRPGKLLKVRCVQLPAAESAMRWTQEVTMRFASCEIPCWEEEGTACMSVETPGGSEGKQVCFCVPGTTETVLEAEAENASGEVCGTCAIRTKKGRIVLDGLSLESGETLRMRLDEHALLGLTAEKGGTVRSVMAARRVESADEVMIAPGGDEVWLVSDVPLRWRLLARGRWL